MAKRGKACSDSHEAATPPRGFAVPDDAAEAPRIDIPVAAPPAPRPARARDASADMHEYRFTCRHSHADVLYKPGDIIEVNDANAALIRTYAGADALDRVR